MAAGTLQQLIGGSDLTAFKGDGESSLGGEVSHMAERGGDAVVGAQELAYLSDLVGRLDDDQFHAGLRLEFKALALARGEDLDLRPAFGDDRQGLRDQLVHGLVVVHRVVVEEGQALDARLLR